MPTASSSSGVPRGSSKKPRVALVHDWLTNWAGGERVLWSLHELYPDAPIYTSVFNAEKMPEFAKLDVRTSFLQKWPLAKQKHQLFPLLRGYAFENFDFSDYDIVISDSTAEGKGIITKPGTLHISYIHTPTRYYWSDYDYYLNNPGFGALDPLVRLVMPGFVKRAKRWDYAAAQRPDILCSNSNNIKRRIKKYYDRDATTIYPPVDIKRFTLTEEKSDFYLVVGRLVPYKRVDLVVEACTKLGKQLMVIGEGSELDKLKAMAGPTVTFLGRLDDKQTAEYYAKARGFIFAGEEDFGITPLEAMACGTPIIAYNKGGAIETVVNETTGVFFNEQNLSSLAQAITKLESIKPDPAKIREHALSFDDSVFKKNIATLVDSEWAKFKENTR